MKVITLGLAIALVAPLVLGINQEAKKAEHEDEIIAFLLVSSGELKIVKKEDYRFIVQLNGKSIHENHSFMLGIYRYYSGLGGYAVVLLDEISGGNICQAFSFRFIAWKCDGTHTISKSFGNCEGPVIRQDGKKLILFFKSYIMKHSKKEHLSETWVFESGQLKRYDQ